MVVSTHYASFIRTAVPVAAGLLLTQALRLHAHLDQATVTDAVTSGISAGYYALFRVLEKHVHPRFGWLLGLARPPQYAPSGRFPRRALRRFFGGGDR